MTTLRAIVLCLSLVTIGQISPAYAGQPAPPAAQASEAPGTSGDVRREFPIDPPRAQRGSGFWTSNRPAKGGSYRYRLLLIGLAVLIMMLALMIHVVRSYERRKAD